MHSLNRCKVYSFKFRSVLLFSLIFTSLTAQAEGLPTTSNDIESIEDDVMLEPNFDDEAPFKSLSGISNLNQLERDSTSATTVLDAELLHDLGLDEISDAMRLVPGMRVSAPTHQKHFIQYHGTNATKGNRLAISIDSLSKNITPNRTDDWNLLGLDFEDIEQINVVRGPGGSSLGDNSMLGSLNIETKDPRTERGWTGSAKAGSMDTRNYTLGWAGTLGDKIFNRFSLSDHFDDGYDLKQDRTSDRIDYTDFSRFTMQNSIDVTPKDRIDTRFSFLDGKEGLSVIAPYFTPPAGYTFDHPIKLKAHDYSLAWTHQEDDYIVTSDISEQESDSYQHWQACVATYLYMPTLHDLSEVNRPLADAFANFQPIDKSTLNPTDLALLGAVETEFAGLGADSFTPACLAVDKDVITTVRHAKTRVEFNPIENMRVAVGAEYIDESYFSLRYLRGAAENDSKRAFAQMEYRMDKYTFNLGGLAENDKNVKDPIYAVNGSVNFHVNEDNTVRLAVNEGFRAPDIIETDRDWTYYLPAVGPNALNTDTLIFYNESIATEELTLEAERIRSLEISYLAKSIKGVDFDVKYFYDEMFDVIPDRSFFSENNLENNGDSTLQGVEFDIKYAISRYKFGTVYSYIDQDASHDAEKMLYSRHQGAAYAIVSLPKSTKASIAYYGNSRIVDSGYDRYDFNLMRNWQVSDALVSAQFTARHFATEQFALNVSELDDNKSYYESPNLYSVTLKAAY